MMTSILRKALSSLYAGRGNGSKGTMSSYALNAPRNFGQPLPQQGQDPFGLTISQQRMRELAMKTPTLSACLNAVMDYATNVPIKIRNVDSSQPADPDTVDFVYRFLAQPNPDDTWTHYISKTFRDVVVLGQAGSEIVWNTRNKPHSLYALDTARLRIDFDENGEVEGYDMIDAHGNPIKGADGTHAWEPKDIIYFRRDATSDSQYSLSRVQQLFVLGIIESLMLDFIGKRFTDSNIPYGLLDLGDISDQELGRAIEMWNDQVRSPHDIVLTGSKSGSKWYPFAYNLSELEATNLLLSIQAKIMGILGVTKNELGDSQDVSKSNGYNLSYTFKKRAIEPLLNEFCNTLTARLLWSAFGFTDLELYYQEIDSRDELLQAQIDEIYLRNAILSPNQIRNRRGDPSVEGGEEVLLFMGSSAIPLRLVASFAEMQLQAMQAEIAATMAAGQGGEGGNNIKMPLLRSTGPAMKFTTPDGAGSSSFKFSLTQKQPQNNEPPRGKVHQLRAIGHRTEQNEGK